MRRLTLLLAALLVYNVKSDNIIEIGQKGERRLQALDDPAPQPPATDGIPAAPSEVPTNSPDSTAPPSQPTDPPETTSPPNPPPEPNNNPASEPSNNPPPEPSTSDSQPPSSSTTPDPSASSPPISDEPTTPVTPSSSPPVNDEPTTPVTPVTPDPPSTPPVDNGPTTPATPVTPDPPSTPPVDNRPTTPVTPVTPDPPSTPPVDNGPTTPVTPVTPDPPSTPPVDNGPTTPATPVTPDPPSTPPVDNGPTTPVTPVTPDPPSTPPVDNGPTTPATPVTPDPPSTPPVDNGPTTPATPVTPDPPSTPPVDNGPTTPVTPVTPDPPSTPPVDNGPTTPVTPVTPDPPSTPPVDNGPTTPVTPVTPDPPSTPPVDNGPTTPVTPVTPDPPSTPPVDNRPTTPVTPVTPDPPSTPPVDNGPTTPVTPVTPDPPSTPPVDNRPTTPVTPVTPDPPSTPPVDNGPTTPVTPVTPDPPSTPPVDNGPTTPVTPVTPDPPSTPTVDNRPTTPVTPVTPDPPSTPPVDNGPTTPVTPVTPDPPSTPPVDNGLSAPSGRPAPSSSPPGSASGSAASSSPPSLTLVDIKVAVETNPPTTPGSLTKRDEVGVQEAALTPSPSPSPSKIDDWEATATPEKYVRGQTDIQVTGDPWGGSTEASNGSTTAGMQQPLVIGGKRRNTVSVPGTPYDNDGTTFHDVVRYTASILAGMSVLLLFLFHFASLDPSLQWKRLAWSPNTWEFCVYVAYLQQMASYSQLTMTKSPYFLWDFTDGFSWTNFLMHQSIPSLRARRLKTVIILDGLVGYADRIGINESAILLHVISGFAVVVAFFATIFCTSAMYARIKSRATRDSHVDEYGVWNIPYRVLGLLVLVWFFALYPLCVMASFEIYMEIHASLVAPGSLVAAIIALVVVCAFMLAYTMRTLLSKTETELRQYKMIAIWGVFYLDCWFITRLFFVFGVFFQIISAICIGVLDSNAFLLSILIGIQVLNLIAVLVVKPFADRLVRNITLSVQVLKIINFSLGFAFLQGQSLPSSERLAIANAFIGINTLVIIAWFVRLLVVFAHALSAFLMRERVGNGSYSPRESPDSGGLEMYKFAATSTPEIPTGRFTGLQSLSLSSAQESATWSYYLRDCSSPRPLPGAVLSPSI